MRGSFWGRREGRGIQRDSGFPGTHLSLCTNDWLLRVNRPPAIGFGRRTPGLHPGDGVITIQILVVRLNLPCSANIQPW